MVAPTKKAKQDARRAARVLDQAVSTRRTEHEAKAAAAVQAKAAAIPFKTGPPKRPSTQVLPPGKAPKASTPSVTPVAQGVLPKPPAQLAASVPTQGLPKPPPPQSTSPTARKSSAPATALPLTKPPLTKAPPAKAASSTDDVMQALSALPPPPIPKWEPKTWWKAGQDFLSSGALADCTSKAKFDEMKDFGHRLTMSCDPTVVNVQRVHPGGSSWLMTVVVTSTPDRVVVVCDAIANVLGFSPRPFAKGDDEMKVIIHQRRLWALANLREREWWEAEGLKRKGSGKSA